MCVYSIYHESQPVGKPQASVANEVSTLGVVAYVDNSGEVNPEPGGGERQKEAGHWVAKMSGFW